jgi:hypothetical protein
VTLEIEIKLLQESLIAILGKIEFGVYHSQSNSHIGTAKFSGKLAISG